jgi:Flp pilus assembly pilin Flp
VSGTGSADLTPMTPLPGRTDRIRSSWRREEAQTMAEYAVVLAVITPVVVLAFATFGNAIIPVIDAVRSFL